jgi:hypothetical protein
MNKIDGSLLVLLSRRLILFLPSLRKTPFAAPLETFVQVHGYPLRWDQRKLPARGVNLFVLTTNCTVD